MPRPHFRRPQENRFTRRFGSLFAWIALGILVVLVGAFIGIRIWFNAYLGSPEFRRLMGDLTARYLHGEGEYQPIRFSGTSVFSDGFSAKGGETAPFSSLRADQLRADFNPRGLFDGVWRIDDFSAQRLEVDLDGPRVRLPEPEGASDKKPSAAETSPDTGWLPGKLDIRSANIRDLVLRWGGDGSRPAGLLEGTAVEIEPGNPGSATGDAALEILGKGGVLTQEGYSPLTLETVRMRYRKDAIYVTEATFSHPDGGTVGVTGEVHFEDALAFDIELNNVPIEPYIPEDWRAKLSGQVQGSVHVKAPMPPNGALEVEGSLRLIQGRLEALPLLDEIAMFTQTKEFRRISITNTSCRFHRAGGRLDVTDFVAESPGLLRIQGALVVENGEIDGTFEVGVTPGSLSWLPGSRKRVFTTERDGYLWAPMRLTGPLEAPREDLTARLTDAAADEILGGAENLNEKVKDTARKILDFGSSLLR